MIDPLQALPPSDGRHPARVIRGQVLGGFVRIAIDSHDQYFFYVKDIIATLGSGVITDYIRGKINARARIMVVDDDGRVGSERVLHEGDLYSICGLVPSEALDAFRDQVGMVLEQIRRHGYFAAPGAANPGLPSELMDDPIIRLRTEQIRQQKQIEEARRVADDASGKVDDLREQVGRGPQHWTITAWCTYHGVHVTKSVAKDEGGRVSRICRRRGYVVPEEKVCHGDDFPARRWPLEAILDWWPDFLERYGRPWIEPRAKLAGGRRPWA
jgi:hypothetical protein